MTQIGAFVCLVALAVVSACGSGSSGGQSAAPTPAPTATAAPTATPAPTATATYNGTAAVIHYQLNATGTTALSQQFTDAAGVAGSPETCAQFVGPDHVVSGGHRFYQPLGGGNGLAFTLNLDIVPYSGPGSYTTTTSQLEFSLAGASYHPPFGANGGQVGLKLTTRGDGSGTFIISAWADVNNQAKTESGTLSWTCTNG